MYRFAKLFLVAVALIGAGVAGSKTADAGFGCFPPTCDPYGCSPCYRPYSPPYCPPHGCYRPFGGCHW